MAIEATTISAASLNLHFLKKIFWIVPVFEKWVYKASTTRIENLIVPKTFIKKSYYYNLDMIFMIYLGLDLREVCIMSLLKIIHRYVMMFLKRIKSSFYIYLKYNFVCLHIKVSIVHSWKTKKYIYSIGFF